MNYRKIHSFCIKKGISLAALAEKIGLSRVGFYQAIKKQSLKIDSLEKIAKALDVPIYEFFDDERSFTIVTDSKEAIAAYQVLLNDILKNFESAQGKFLDLLLKLPEEQVTAMFKLKEFTEFRDKFSELLNKEEIETLFRETENILHPEDIQEKELPKRQDSKK
jgi:transcriptional regulator with XRE-family HTH domain